MDYILIHSTISMIVVFSFLYFIANIDNEKKIIPDWLTIPLIIYGILSSVILPILASAGVMGLVLKYLVYKTRTIPFGVATFLGYCFFIAVSIIFALI